jgi:hypothetical protein
MKLVVIYRELDAKAEVIAKVEVIEVIAKAEMIEVIEVIAKVEVIEVIAKVVKMSPHDSLLDSDTTEDCL